MSGAPPPPVIRPPNAAADYQFVGAQLYYTVGYIVIIYLQFRAELFANVV